MVQLIYFLLLLGVCSPLLAQKGAPPDVGSIELLIDRHKKQHNRLEERNKKELQHNAVTKLVKDISTKYEKLHKDLMKKYGIASQWFNLGISSITLLTEVKDLGKAIPPFLSHANKITNPYVLQKYLRAGARIKSEIDFCIKALASIPALRLNAKELTDLVYLLQGHISSIRSILKTYAYAIKGQILYSEQYKKPTLPDYSRIAQEVVKEYFPPKQQ